MRANTEKKAKQHEEEEELTHGNVGHGLPAEDTAPHTFPVVAVTPVEETALLLLPQLASKRRFDVSKLRLEINPTWLVLVEDMTDVSWSAERAVPR